MFNEGKKPAKPNEVPRWYSNVWINFRKDSEGELHAYFVAGLAERLLAHNPDGDVIFSAEDASWVFSEDAILQFANELFTGFDDVKVIAYLRRQDRNVVSFVQQISRGNTKGRGYSLFGEVEGALPEYHPRINDYFDYNERFGKWADIFGNNSMIFRVFEDVIARGSIVESFGQIMGLELKDTDLHKRKSLPKAQQILNQRMMKLAADIQIPREISELAFHGKKMLPPRAEAEEFYAHFRDSNVALNARFQINDREAVFDDGFDDYPVEGNEIMTPEEGAQIMDALIIALLRTDGQRRVAERRRFMLRKKLVAEKKGKK